MLVMTVFATAGALLVLRRSAQPGQKSRKKVKLQHSPSDFRVCETSPEPMLTPTTGECQRAEGFFNLLAMRLHPTNILRKYI